MVYLTILTYTNTAYIVPSYVIAKKIELFREVDTDMPCHVFLGYMCVVTMYYYLSLQIVTQIDYDIM